MLHGTEYGAPILGHAPALGGELRAHLAARLVVRAALGEAGVAGLAGGAAALRVAVGVGEAWPVGEDVLGEEFQPGHVEAARLLLGHGVLEVDLEAEDGPAVAGDGDVEAVRAVGDLEEDCVPGGHG